MDPVQYKQDLADLMVARAKFLEDIYSNDCQFVLKLPSLTLDKHISELRVL
jgi:hypothetical protein